MPASATRLHGSPHTGQASRSRKNDRQPAGSASMRFATTVATTPSRASTGSISSWNPAEMINGSWAATSSGRPGLHDDGVEQPVEHLVERRRDRRHLDADHLVERQLASDLLLERVEHVDVAEAPRSPCGACRVR